MNDYFISTKYGPTNVIQYGLSDDISKTSDMFDSVKRLIIVVPGKNIWSNLYDLLLSFINRQSRSC